jgi:hypothetical protein
MIPCPSLTNASTGLVEVVLPLKTPFVAVNPQLPHSYSFTLIDGSTNNHPTQTAIRLPLQPFCSFSLTLVSGNEAHSLNSTALGLVAGPAGLWWAWTSTSNWCYVGVNSRYNDGTSMLGQFESAH